MLNNKKHVLCEKPAVLKKAQAEELYSLAKEKVQTPAYIHNYQTQGNFRCNPVPYILSY